MLQTFLCTELTEMHGRPASTGDLQQEMRDTPLKSHVDHLTLCLHVSENSSGDCMPVARSRGRFN